VPVAVPDERPLSIHDTAQDKSSKRAVKASSGSSQWRSLAVQERPCALDSNGSAVADT